MQGMGENLVEVCWCLNIESSFELLMMTTKPAEPICIEEVLGPGKSINNFRQTMVVKVMQGMEILPWINLPVHTNVLATVTKYTKEATAITKSETFLFKFLCSGIRYNSADVT